MDIFFFLTLLITGIVSPTCAAYTALKSLTSHGEISLDLWLDRITGAFTILLNEQPFLDSDGTVIVDDKSLILQYVSEDIGIDALGNFNRYVISLEGK